MLITFAQPSGPSQSNDMVQTQNIFQTQFVNGKLADKKTDKHKICLFYDIAKRREVMKTT